MARLSRLGRALTRLRGALAALAGVALALVALASLGTVAGLARAGLTAGLVLVAAGAHCFGGEESLRISLSL